MQNYINPYQSCPIPQQGPNAVSINIISPQAFASPNAAQCNNGGYYSLYGQNVQPGMPFYPQNYNNLMQYPYNLANVYNQGYPQAMNNQNGLDSSKNMSTNTALLEKTQNPEEVQPENKTKTEEKDKTKKVVPLTDDYIKSLENYMNNDNPKIRLIGAKEVLERFKEDENRKDNPNLMPLLNKALRDSSAAVRFLGLTTLQLGYAVGNDETVTILKEIQAQNKDKIGEDSLLASEILLNMSRAPKVEVPMTEEEIAKEEAKSENK